MKFCCGIILLLTVADVTIPISFKLYFIFAVKIFRFDNFYPESQADISSSQAHIVLNTISEDKK